MPTLARALPVRPRPASWIRARVSASAALLGVGLHGAALAQTGAAPPAPADKRVYLSADQIYGVSDQQTVLQGKAEIRKADTLVQSERMQYAPNTDYLLAQGQVRIERGGNVYEGDELGLYVERFEGFFTAPRYRFGQNGAHGEARRADFADSQHMTVQDATYTTCRRLAGPGWLPDWVLSAGSISIDNEEDIGVAQRAYLQFKGVPLLPVPPISFPLSDKRKSGFLAPTIGLGNANGFELAVPYYWNIAPNRDLTLTPTLMTARGVNLGAELRYLEPQMEGSTKLSYMPSDRLRGSDRWSAAVLHKATVASPWGGLALSANINRVGDDYFWSDFANSGALTNGSTIAGATPRQLPAELSASWVWADWSSSFKYQKWQTLQDPSEATPMVPAYDRVPQWTLRVAQNNVRGLDWAVDTDFTRFEADRRLTGQPNAQRAFAQAQLSYPLVWPAFFITPKVQLHTAAYQFDTAIGGQSSANSVVPSFSLDSGMVLERQAQWGGTELLQTLEPRAFYVYTPYRDQRALPNYDTALNAFNFATIFTENAFVGHDKVSDNNLLTLGLTSRLLRQDNGAQLASFGVAQRLRFEAQRVTANPSDAPAAAGVSDILFGANVNLDERWALDATVQYNGHTDESVRSVIGGRYHPGDYQLLNLAYRFQRYPSDTIDANEQVDLSWQWPMAALWGGKGGQRSDGSGHYYSVGRLAYSLRESRLVDTLLGVEYDAGCWISRLVLVRSQINQDTANTSLMFQLEFVGFTRIGIDPLKTLTSSISRYQNLRDSKASNSGLNNDNGSP